METRSGRAPEDRGRGLAADAQDPRAEEPVAAGEVLGGGLAGGGQRAPAEPAGRAGQRPGAFGGPVARGRLADPGRSPGTETAGRRSGREPSRQTPEGRVTMDSWPLAILGGLARAALIQLVAACAVAWLVRQHWPQHPRECRLACVLILLQGWMIVPFSLVPLGYPVEPSPAEIQRRLALRSTSREPACRQARSRHPTTRFPS